MFLHTDLRCYRCEHGPEMGGPPFEHGPEMFAVEHGPEAMFLNTDLRCMA